MLLTKLMAVRAGPALDGKDPPAALRRRGRQPERAAVPGGHHLEIDVQVPADFQPRRFDRAVSGRL